MPEQFNAYHEWLGIPPEGQRPNHYQLLGLRPFEDNPRVIENAADRQMAHLRTFQSGSQSAESQKILNEVAAAKICLLRADKKAAYDAQLRATPGDPPPAPATQPYSISPQPHVPQPVYHAPVVPAAAYPAPVVAQTTPSSDNVIDSYVIDASLTKDDGSRRGNSSRSHGPRGRKPESRGARRYSVVALVAVIAALIGVLWLKANQRQNQIADAERSSGSAKIVRAKKQQRKTAKPAMSQFEDVHSAPELPGTRADTKQIPSEPTPVETTARVSASDTRSYWSFQEGYYQQTNGRNWVRVYRRSNVTVNFVESKRTAEYVELRRWDNSGLIRLSSKQALVLSDESAAGVVHAEGEWRSKPDDPNRISEIAVGQGPASPLTRVASNPREPASADAGGWVDLLDWAAGFDWAPRGINWNDACEQPPTKDGITLKARPCNRFPLPAVIDGDYEMEVEFTRHSGVECVSVFFPIGLHNMMLEISGSAGRTGGVSWIDGHWYDRNSTFHQPCSFTNGERHRLAFRVHREGDRAAFNIDWDNTKDYISWQGQHASLTNCDGGGWKLSMTRRPWLAGFERVTFHNVRVRMTSGEIRRDFSTEADRQRDLAQGFVRLIDLPANSPRVGWGQFLVNQIPVERWPPDTEQAWPLISLKAASACEDYYGAHAPSRLKCPIPRNAKSFTVTGFNQASRSVKYLVYVDGILKFESGVTDIARIVVQLPPKASLLELVIDPAGPIDYDHSYWCNPQFHGYQGAKSGNLPFVVAGNSVGAGNFTHNQPIASWATAPPEPDSAVPCDEFLFAHANSSVSYAVPADMKRFTATGYCVRSNSAKYQVWADTRMIYQSPPVGLVAIDVRLPAGTKTVELKTDDVGNGHSDWSMWCYPRFSRN